jgi:lipid-A-disaccharide synthase
MTQTIFMIAGEASGDDLGAGLIRALRGYSKAPLDVVGVGGEKMTAAGLKSLLPMSELNVMGISEVVAHLPRLLRLIGAMVEEIEERNPAAVVTIDLPDFNFQVAARLKKRGKYKGKLIHYVAPSVWAWRAGRAKKISQFLDGIMCLFPFEPAYFPKIKAAYVGHPVIEHKILPGVGQTFRETHSIPPEAKTLGLLFGSRPHELKASKDVLLKSAALVKSKYPDLHLIIPTLPHLEYEMFQITNAVDIPMSVVSEPERKWEAFAACDAAIAVSGTVGLELAYAGIPHVITYKVNPTTWMAMKALVKVKYAHLGNILLNEPAIDEFLQGKSEPIGIGRAILKIFKVPGEREKRIASMNRIREKLMDGNDKAPSLRAAEFVMEMIKS